MQHLCHDFGEASLPEQSRPMRSFIDAQSLMNEDKTRVLEIFSETCAEAARLGIALRLPNVEPRQHPPDTPGRKRCDWPWRASDTPPDVCRSCAIYSRTL